MKNDSTFFIAVLLFCLSHSKHVLYRVDFAHGLEREILVIHYHPLLTLLERELLDVREHGDGDDDTECTYYCAQERKLMIRSHEIKYDSPIYIAYC